MITIERSRRRSPRAAGKWCSRSNGPLKTAHLLRWHARALAAAYPLYASLGPLRAAWHLDLFERPDAEQAFWRSARRVESISSALEWRECESRAVLLCRP